ncbi:diguanylate cyclase (GGDEF) domain-containing protein [Beggiatoa alba B18LD]|uniref:diguanylate cyclase n=1 Tax=Beggiatoa alba B18LD TaxID=395493 RepID=I3CFM7_9GAMM|nr:diguanylate cyclase [Beggiatoa alba]EIJ42420.1 diguanylate cyclase (GGDEF) domain-containing protein [Beggiatoa alba B18LD]
MSSISEQQSQLQKLYLHSMIEKRTELINGMLLAEQQNWQGDAVAKLEQIVVRLIGAGVYGFADISSLAYTVEQLLKAEVINDKNTLYLSLKRLCDLLTIYAEQHNTNPSSLFDAIVAPLPLKHILYIDNRNSENEAFVKQMEYMGYQITWCATLEELIPLIANLQVDVVLMDVLTTHNLTQVGTVLKTFLLTKTPCFFTSYQDTIETRLTAIAAGATHYLPKPITLANLQTAFEHIISPRFKNPPHILLLEANTTENTASNYHQALRSTQLHLHIVHTATDMINTLIALQPQLLLINLNIGIEQGIHLLTLLKQEDAYLTLPVILLTDDNHLQSYGQHHAVSNEDYLPIPNTPTQTEYVIQFILKRIQHAHRLNALQAYDGLTQLLNTNTFRNRLLSSIANAERSGSPIAVAMIDIDNFKQLNQEYGYWIGNNVLRQIAKMLRQRFRRGDLLGRYKDDCFVIALNDADMLSAQQVLEQLVEEIANSQVKVNNTLIPLTLSAGIAYYPGHLHHEPLINSERDILQATEKAVQEAKRRGRNQVVATSLETIL